MSATYNDALPTAKDRVRAVLGDIDMAPALLSDEHIVAVLAAEATEAAAVARLANELIVRFAQRPTTVKAGDVEVDYKDRIPQWQALVARYAPAAPASSPLSFVPVRYGRAESDEYARS